MRTRCIAGLLGAAFLLAPLAFSADKPQSKQPAMSRDMREAIAFERAKDRADARQARKEAIHPSVTYNDANRSADRSTDENTKGRTVKDPGPAPVKKDQ